MLICFLSATQRRKQRCATKWPACESGEQKIAFLDTAMVVGSKVLEMLKMRLDGKDKHQILVIFYF